MQQTISNYQLNKCLIVGDIHFGLRSNSHEALAVTTEFFNKLLIPKVDELIEKFGKNEVSVIFTGDINDSKQLINSFIQNIQIHIFKKLASKCKCFIIIGNHDMPFSDAKLLDIDGSEYRVINSCESLGLIPNIELIVEPTVINNIQNKKVLLHPYTHRIENPNSFDCDFGFSHIEIAEFSYEGKIVESEGHNIISDFSSFVQFFSGHLHKHQFKDNVYYIGSVYQTKRSESTNKVGFGFMDFETNSFQWIDNNLSPKYFNIILENFLKLEHKLAQELCFNNYVSILVPASNTHKINQTEIQNSIVGYKSLEFVPISEYVKEIQIDSENVEIDAAVLYGSLSDKIEQYLNSIDVLKLNALQSIELTEELKSKLLKDLNDLYIQVSSNNVEEIEL